MEWSGYSDYSEMAAYDVIRAAERCAPDEKLTVEEVVCGMTTKRLHSFLEDRDERAAVYLTPGSVPGEKSVHRRAKRVVRLSKDW